jgi:DNA polymerase-3 subunit beta
MKATLDARSLRSALARVKPAATHKYGPPVLMSIEVHAEGDSLRLRATNLETFAETTVAATVHEAGTVLIPFAAFNAAAKGKGDAAITVDDDNLTASITVGPISTSITLLFPVEEYPRWVDIGELRATVEVPVSDLAYVLRAAATSELRVALHGLNFSDSFVCATDSYRLHTCRAEIDGLGNEGVTYSLDALNAAAKHLRSSVTCELGEKFGRYSDPWKQTTYYGRRIDANFPNWRQLIPESTARAITFDVDQLRPVLLAGNKKDQENVKLTDRSGRLHAFVKGTNAEAELSATIEGDETFVAFNPAFLVDALSIVEHGPITLRGIDHLKPWKLTDGPLCALVMPVRIS